jgi:uncharacterized protein (DUF488 family)
MIYTLGYQRLDIAQLDALIAELDCILVDCRAQPFSRRPEFRRAALAQHYAYRYVWKGDVLGGMPKGATEHKVSAEGLDWLRAFEHSRASNVLLMCMEENPSHCHRHQLIAGPHFPQALHIWQGRLFRAADLSAIQTGEARQLEPVSALHCWR